MYKTEAHLHVMPVSACSSLPPREAVRLFKEAGYDTIIISDHFASHHFNKLGEDKSFADKVEMLCNSYLEAKDEGEHLGINVLFSVELSLHGNHYLLYGVTKEFLLLREDIFNISLEEFHAHAKAHGITIIQAHPNRRRSENCAPCPEYVDGFEGINACPRKQNNNEETIALARKLGMPITCGSDCHRVTDVGVSATLSEEPITSIEQYLELMRAGKLVLSVNGTGICYSL